jgi:hypothetical protein
VNRDDFYISSYYSFSPLRIKQYKHYLKDELVETVEWNVNGYPEKIMRHIHDKDITIKQVIVLMLFRHRLRNLVKFCIIQSFLDSSLISDLGNIVMLYYFKE